MPHEAIRFMMRAPTLSAIYAAELRVAQSRLQTHGSLHRGQLALRALGATLVRPASLLTVTTVAAIFGYGLIRCIVPRRLPRAQTDSASSRESVMKITPVAVFILPLIVQYAKQQLPALLR
ncbi:MAG: hypothetical protein H7252_05700, partial [Cytophaga sp.]|nr:hypothetical protein [Undibacterium sp.]